MTAQRPKTAKRVSFTARGLRRGAVVCIPLYPGALAFGLTFGALAASKGLSLIEATAMSLFVFAGASQVAAIDVWTDPVPVTTMIIVTAIINSRMILASASLYPWSVGTTAWQKFLTFFFLADGNWAAGMAEHQKGEWDIGIIVGGGLVLAATWTPITTVGHLLGSFIDDPKAFGLDMLVPLFFMVMLVPLWRGAGFIRNPNLLPWGTSALVSSALFLAFDNHWYLLIGALAGALVAALQPLRAVPDDD